MTNQMNIIARAIKINYSMKLTKERKNGQYQTLKLLQKIIMRTVHVAATAVVAMN